MTIKLIQQFAQGDRKVFIEHPWPKSFRIAKDLLNELATYPTAYSRVSGRTLMFHLENGQAEFSLLFGADQNWAVASLVEDSATFTPLQSILIPREE